MTMINFIIVIINEYTYYVYTIQWSAMKSATKAFEHYTKAIAGNAYLYLHLSYTSLLIGVLM